MGCANALDFIVKLSNLIGPVVSTDVAVSDGIVNSMATQGTMLENWLSIHLQ